MANNFENIALKAEQTKDIKKAAFLYENSIQNEKMPSANTFINLLFIYFIINDPGDRDYYRVDMEFVNFGNQRASLILQLAKQHYPNFIELNFWENYMNFIFYGDPPFDEVNIKFSQQDESLVPYFYFYDPESNLFYDKAQRLLELVKNENTCKERYLKSILVAKFRRRNLFKINMHSFKWNDHENL